MPQTSLPTSITAATFNSGVLATAGTTTHATDHLDLHRRYNEGWISVTDYGATGDGVTDDTAEIQAAFDAALAAGKAAYFPGKTFYIASGLTARCSIISDPGAIITTDQEITALTIGSATAVDSRLWLQLPAVKQSSRKWTATGGSSPMTGTLGTDVGVTLRNIDASTIWLPWVRGFSTNVLIAPAGSRGHVHNTYHVGDLDNGAINLSIAPASTGAWANQNLFLGGRYSQDSVGFPPVSNTRQVSVSMLTGGNAPNSNLWLNPSFEGDVPEYHIYLNGAISNRFVACRLETAAGDARIHFGTQDAIGSTYNHVDTVDLITALVVTSDAGSAYNALSNGPSNAHMSATGASGAVRVMNAGSSAYPFYTVYPAGTSPLLIANADKWTLGMGADWLWAKATGDATSVSRWKVDTATGRQYIGTALVQFGAVTGSPEGAVTAPVGSMLLRVDGGAGTTLYVKESGTGNTGWVGK